VKPLVRILNLGGAVALACFALAARAEDRGAENPGAAVAATAAEEAAMAGKARNVTRSAINTVFGSGQGAAPGTAPAEAAPAGAAPADAAVAAIDGAVAAAVVDPNADPAPGEEIAVEVVDTRRDPFRPFTLDLRPAMDDTEILSPLQRYELPQLRLAGVVLDLATPRAMLQDNSGMGYIVTPGTPIGRRHGVVKSIEPRRVVVEEIVLDYYGRETTHQVAIDMPTDDKSDSASQEKP
jgi:type IV pilus assembly protein PilP